MISFINGTTLLFSAKSSRITCSENPSVIRVTSLFPLQPGRVAEVIARENQEVAEGAALIRLEDGAARHRLAEAEAGVELCRLRLKEARKLPEQHRSRVAQQEAALEAVDSRLAAARQILVQRQRQSQPA